MKIRSIGLCLKAEQPQAAEMLRGLVKWCEDRGVTVAQDPDCAHWTGAEALPRHQVVQHADLVVVLGGDGTLLSVARAAGTRQVPILGINLGTLGFLTEINVEETIAALEKVVAGEVEVQQRIRLDVRVLREGEEIGPYHALNDAVIAKTNISRMVDLQTFADDAEVTTYHADGLIVSTPTGSTAYSLSAGGPLLLPGTDVMVLTPICSHALTQRPLVLPAASRIEIRVHARGGEVTLTVDGQESLELHESDRVLVARSPHPTWIVSSPFRNRFEIMRTKLRWGQR